MRTWQGRSKATTNGYRLFVNLLRLAGVKVAYLFLFPVAAWYFLFSGSTSRPMLYYFRKRLAMGRLQALWGLYRNYYVFGQTLIDKVTLMSGMKSPFTYNFDGARHLKAMVYEQKGGLLLSAHMGSYEAAGHVLGGYNAKLNVLMFDGEDRNIRDYMKSVTAGRSFRIIYVKDDLSHMYRIAEALSNGEVVCMHADRFLPHHNTLTARFLGEDARFPEGPFLLASRFNVPVAYVYGFKQTATQYHLYSTPLRYFYKSETPQQILNDFVNDLQNMVKRYPHHWFNYYDFWQA
jgi:predicted LPLAT superfamily acyltransferase